MDSFVGAIFSFGFNFSPYGWAECNGQLLPISENQALYALIGTTYGGDGVNTFGLPNLQGRTPIGTGQGLGLPNYVLGQNGGNTTVTLTAANLPAHTHPVLSVSMPVSTANGTLTDPNNNYLASDDGSVISGAYFATATPGVHMAALAPVNTSVAGSGNPLNITSPYLAVNYCISLQGIFPQRN